ncbi:hypothetical protein LZ554_004589 [Drepanopeziza brunnea f. sp. 'monogermtubi']|nr:hypothetical protein LZ554_004589 [Drepanopeziza brunnea f. sp. 'monogermtubi']
MYPLFQKGAKPKPPLPEENPMKPKKHADDQPNAAPKKKVLGRPRKTTNLLEEGSPDVGTLKSAVPATSKAVNQAQLLEVDPNNSRRKRRKTSSPNGRVLPAEPAELNSSSPGAHKLKRIHHEGQAKAPAITQDTTTPRANIKKKNHHAKGSVESLPTDLAAEVSRSDDELHSVAQGTSALAHIIQPDVLSGPSSEPKPPQTLPKNPKKVLRLNPRTGTIGSPPPPKPFDTVEPNPPKQTKGRGRKSKSLIVRIRYGKGEDGSLGVAEKIHHIINPPPNIHMIKDVAPAAPTTTPPKPRAPISTKPIHPLFLGRVAPKDLSPPKAPSDATEIIDFTKKIKPTTQARVRPGSRETGASPKNSAVSYSGISTKTAKFPGAIEPAWPWQGMVHVRGFDELARIPNSERTRLPFSSQSKKSKYHSVEISSAEDIIETLASQLSIKNVVESIQEVNPDEYPSAPQCLRVPTKHYESGLAIQKRVRKELKSRLVPPKTAAESSSEDEIQLHSKNRANVHPAIARVYDSIPTSSSAFDKGQCETHSWAQKYSPKCAADVLQPGREALILKEWVEALTVQSVESGPGGKGQSASKTDNSGKRKRNSKKLDGFVISTDEEDNDMDEITEPEDNMTSGGQFHPKRTVIKSKDAAALLSKGSKVSNAVVVSGPHGCGKTAAIYAVAKELGFEVFEINSSSRRSGKDILEKVGDMTRNHHVQRTAATPQLDGVDEDRDRIDSALADDLKSGRQGTMNSFFKPNPAAKLESKPRPKHKVKETSTQPPDIEHPKITSTVQVSKVIKNGFLSTSSTKKQKQSLILIEEADVLYKEDSQFWVTVMGLIATSRRPIIITCTDESLLPIQSLTLYGIIRMATPSLDLAVDYILLVAACEGHIVTREAVKGLYEARGSDLRASLTELNFWCQFAVGDVKGGLEWYYPRSPGGNHVDEHGSTIRVVSAGTYHTDIEEETLHEACDEWRLDLGDWEKNIGLDAWAEKMQDNSCGKKDDLAALGMYVDFADSMSVADLCSGGTFAPMNQILLDVSFPELSAKVRDDYTLGYELKEAPTLVDYNTLSKDISLFIKSRTRKVLHVDQHIRHNFEVPTELDRPSETEVLRLIRDLAISPNNSLTRYDFSQAFDPISATEKYIWSTSLEASTFDRTMTLIVEDLAPYVRSIVAYDARLQEDRLKMSNLLSEGGAGRRGKRMRTTRAAMSALEGGARVSTRRDRYFTAALNPSFVLKTGMPGWIQASLAEIESPDVLNTSRRSSTSILGREMMEDNERDELMGSSPG